MTATGAIGEIFFKRNGRNPFDVEQISTLKTLNWEPLASVEIKYVFRDNLIFLSFFIGINSNFWFSL